jgi:nucleotide-binding universal stress UspA family protein
MKGSAQIETILVGADSHEQSWDALCLAATLSRAFGARLVVAAAVQPAPAPIAATAGSEHSRRAELDRIFEAVGLVLGETPYERYELEDDPARALHDLAGSRSVDLIVLGSTHHGTLGRVYPGSLGERLLEGAPCPVAVAPHGYAKHEHLGFGLVGVGFDGGEDSTFALAAGEQLARALGAELRVITVDPPDDGDPAAFLATKGVELDLLVVGSRGRGPVERALLGSVSSQLIRTAPCPVLVMPRAAHPADHRSRAATG